MNKIRILKRETLTISKGVIISKDSYMQTINVTRVWFGRLPVEIPYFKLVIAMLIGIAAYGTPFSVFSVPIIIGVGGILAYYIYLRTHYCVSFELSSGQVYSFTAIQKEFIELSYEEVKKIMNNENGLGENVKINFNDCKINVISDNKGTIEINNIGTNVDNSVNNNIDNRVDKSFNTTKNSNNKNSNNNHSFNTTIDFDMVSNDLKELLKYPNISELHDDVNTIRSALLFAQKRDEQGLTSTLKKLSKQAIKIIEVSAAITTLHQFFH